MNKKTTHLLKLLSCYLLMNKCILRDEREGDQRCHIIPSSSVSMSSQKDKQSNEKRARTEEMMFHERKTKCPAQSNIQNSKQGGVAKRKSQLHSTSSLTSFRLHCFGEIPLFISCSIDSSSFLCRILGKIKFSSRK